ncbi:MAG TPA: inositol monophosphatase family protein [Glaciihabitans sp.]|jgi:myo-inositol-1(or 4)-monophosphatase|nr:inositol monophosphatase family protein [Glaciihabitans sp.]
MSRELLDLARTVALNAGAMVKTRRAEGVTVADLKSSPVDVVTLADRESETLIRSLLAEARPDDGFFGEEGAADLGTSGLTWVVDPIDGTVNYLYDIPQYAISIAVVEGGPDPLTWRALAGCVFNPASGELFSAAEGGGAFLGERPIHAAAPVDMSQALVGTGFSYSAETRALQGAVVAQLLPEVRDIRRFGAAALDLCAVANGRLNAYYERGLSPWDHAAGALIAREAGAVVLGWDGAAPSKEFIIAGQLDLVNRLEKRLKELGV